MGCTSKRAPERRTQRVARASTLPAGKGGRILDQLLLLEQVIPRGAVLQVLADTGCLDARRCTLTGEATCWVIVAMGLVTDVPVRQVSKAPRRLYPGEHTPHRSSLGQAPQRLGLAPVRLPFERLARCLATPRTPAAFCRGLRPVGIDGVVYSVPDADATAQAFGYPKAGGAGAPSRRSAT